MCVRSISVTEILRITNLSAGYGKLTVIHDLNLEIAPSCFTAILGPNGSGKSTLLKSIFGLAEIFSGSVQLAGQELIGLPPEAIGQHGIAYVPQRSNIFTAMTVRENLRLAARNMNSNAAAQALSEAYALFPILEKRQNQRAGQLSGGERQMLAIAIGWLPRPRLMLLDEPSAGLAPLLVTEVFRTLQLLRQQGITLVVVEQNARSVLRWCENVFILREGQLAFEGTARECLADEEMVKTYLGATRRAAPQ
jgi:branched-chain amino acid transport system ATP-binding protein